METDQSLASLPRAYRLALTLRQLGADNQLIADCLEIEPSAVGPLLDIGTRKLDRSTTRPQISPEY